MDRREFVRSSLGTAVGLSLGLGGAMELYDMTKEEKLGVIRKMWLDPYYFAKIIVPHLIYDEPADYHYGMFNLFKTRPQNFLGVLARGSGKTTIISTIGCLYDIAFDLEEFTVLIKKTYDQAKWDLDNIRSALLYNDRFKFFFGERVPYRDNVDTLEIQNPITRHRSYIISLGIGNEVRGRLAKNMRISKLLGDDIESEKNTETAEQRKKVRDHIYKNAMPGLDPKRGKTWLVGTIAHYDSLMNRIWEASKAGDKTWHVVYSRAWEGELFTEKAKATFPSRFPIEWLRMKHDEYKNQSMLSSFFQEYQNIPVSDEDRDFPEEIIRYHDYRLTWSDNQGWMLENDKDKVLCTIFLGVDPSVGHKDGDFTGITLSALTRDMSCYVLESYRKKLRIFDIVDHIWEKSALHRHAIDNIIVEQQNAFQWLFDAYRARCQREGRWLHWSGVKIVQGQGEGSEGRGKKRLRTLADRFHSERLFIKKEHTDLLEEMMTFPKSAHDDALDSLWLSCHPDKCFPPPEKRNIEPKDKVPKFRRVNWLTA